MKTTATTFEVPPEGTFADTTELELLATVYKTAGLNQTHAEQAARADLMALYPEPRMVCCAA